MSTGLPNACQSCTHHRTVDPAGRRTCEAYPLGIPLNITSGLYDHTKPVEGDHGVMWELDPNKEGKYKLYLAWRKNNAASSV